MYFSVDFVMMTAQRSWAKCAVAILCGELCRRCVSRASAGPGGGWTRNASMCSVRWTGCYRYRLRSGPLDSAKDVKEVYDRCPVSGGSLKGKEMTGVRDRLDLGCGGLFGENVCLGRPADEVRFAGKDQGRALDRRDRRSGIVALV